MAKKVLVTIQGDYLGKIVSMQANPDNTISVITEKLNILRAEPITFVSSKELYKIYEELKKESLKTRSYIFFILANVEYLQRTILQEDILPILNPDANAIIVLRSRNWDRLPFEAIGVPSPEEAEQVAKWYTLYVAMKNTLLQYHRELDRLRMDLIRYAEYARKLEEHNSELSKLVTELQKKTVDLHVELNSMISSVENFEKLAETKEEESEIWRKAYIALKDKISSLLDIVPRIVEYSNKLATIQLERELEVSTLRQDISKLEEEVRRTIREMEILREQFVAKKLAEEKKEEIETPKEEKETEETEETTETGEEEKT
ncbi:MAG: hypothetical protein QXW35_02420 [Candidatus Aenigmatarchaeota archaeon]